jgi:DNA-binding protein YbaB
MFDELSADDALQRIDEWEQSIARRAELARSLAAQTAELTATARSRDGLVEVTIGSDGQVRGIDLDERTRQQSAAATSRTIMETLRAANADLLRQFEEATAATVGAESETGRMLVAGLRRRLEPAQDDDVR